LTTYFLQGSAATDLRRGATFNSNFPADLFWI